VPWTRQRRRVRADTRMTSAASGSVRKGSSLTRPILSRCGQAVTDHDPSWPYVTNMATAGRFGVPSSHGKAR
jgi:hypothetical protein